MLQAADLAPAEPLSVDWPTAFQALMYTHAASGAENRRPHTLTRGPGSFAPPGRVPLAARRKRGAAPSEPVFGPMLQYALRALLTPDDAAIDPVSLGHDPRRASSQQRTTLDAWRQQLVGQDGGAKEPTLVPVTYTDADDIQLEFGRCAKSSGVVVPDCCYGPECAAFSVLGVTAPLQQYMTPSEQAEIDSAAVPVFETDGACLICIRSVYTSMHSLRGALLLNPAAEINRHAMCIPPFQNTVGGPGGYKESAASITPSSATSLGIHMAGDSGALRLVKNPATGRLYIDQEALKFGGADFPGGASA